MKYTLAKTFNNNRTYAMSLTLIFNSSSLETLNILSLAPDIHALFPTGYFVTLMMHEHNPGNQYAVICGYTSLSFPDEMLPSFPSLWYCYKGAAYLLDLHTAYNKCLSLFKVVGCVNCPKETYYMCLSNIIPVNKDHLC